MKVGYHPDVQKDVAKVLKHYDAITSRLGDEFWTELMSFIEAAAKNPLRFHSDVGDLRRANLKRFPYHFLFRVLPGRIRVMVVRHHKQSPRTGLRRK